MSLIERITAPGPKRLLAIDGGGIRGVLALEVLQRLEDILRAAGGRGDDYRLADDFDYIAGTSTGGIIAAALSIGMSVAEILDFYETCGAQMFVKANLLARLRHKFDDEPLARKLREVFGARTLGADDLRTLLLLVLRNATTDSPWPLSNNPYAKYNDPRRADCNHALPLWQLVRASTAAPTYFPPEVIVLPGGPAEPGREFVFVDGGVTMYNNPSFQMFLMATLDRYWARNPAARWRAGADRLLLVSVGTGTSPDARAGLEPSDMSLLYNASTIPAALMFAAANEQDLLCRVFGACRAGDPLDRELGDLAGSEGPLAGGAKLFTYVRYNAELTRAGLDALGCPHIDPRAVQQLDSVDAIPQLREVGRRVAAQKVAPAHLAGFLPG